MANNRMYLTCLHCLNDKDTPLDQCQFYLAKYYPNTGWYNIHNNPGDNLGAALDKFFDEHKHKESWDQAMYGDHFTIITESMMESSPVVGDKREILKIVAKAAEEGKVGH